MSSVDEPVGPTDDELVRCDVTGAMVHPDDVIRLHGYTVCADGKAQLLEMLRSGELLPGELERPSVLRRFACLFVDGLIFAVVQAVAMMVVMGSSIMSAAGSGSEEELEAVVSGSSPRMWGLTVGLTALLIAYHTYFHGTWGQTLGKMAGKIKVVTSDNQPISMRQAFVRALIYQGPYLLIFIPGFLLGTDWVTIIGWLGGLYFISNVVVALVDRAQQRAIHDRLGDTRVIALD